MPCRLAISGISMFAGALIAGCHSGSADHAGVQKAVTVPSPETQQARCIDVTSYDYNWDNDMLCTRADGSTFYTSYAGAAAFLQSARDSDHYQQGAPTSFAVTVPGPSPTFSTAVPAGVAGIWVGIYDCGQGVTGLRLVVDPDGHATFSFSASNTNPGVPSGEFEMQATSDGLTLTFRQLRWIQRPDQYDMVDLVVTKRSSAAMSGEVIGSGCTIFRLTRATRG